MLLKIPIRIIEIFEDSIPRWIFKKPLVQMLVECVLVDHAVFHNQVHRWNVSGLTVRRVEQFLAAAD